MKSEAKKISISDYKKNLEEKAKDGIPQDKRGSTIPDSEKQNKIKKHLSTNYTPFLDFEFAKKLNGLRPGEVHLVLGRPGKGKSTFNRTLINSFIKNGKNVLLLLSEEESDIYLTLSGLDEKYSKQIIVLSEKHQTKAIADSSEHSYDKISQFIAYIEVLLKDSDFIPNLICFDNIHSSRLIDENDKASLTHLFNCFEALGAKYGCPVMFYAHIDTKLHKVLPYTENHIRGNRVSSILCQSIAAIYLSGETDGAEPRFCFHWIKSRTQGQVNHSKFAFIFDKETKLYKKDFEIDYNTFQHFWMPKVNKIDSALAEEKFSNGMDGSTNRLLTKQGKIPDNLDNLDPLEFI